MTERGEKDKDEDEGRAAASRRSLSGSRDVWAEELLRFGGVVTLNLATS